MLTRDNPITLITLLSVRRLHGGGEVGRGATVGGLRAQLGGVDTGAYRERNYRQPLSDISTNDHSKGWPGLHCLDRRGADC